MNKKDFNFKMLELQNKFFNLAISQAESIKTILKKYDGKKITKRIETDLKKNVDKNLSLTKSYEYWSLTLYCQDRSFENEPNSWGYCSTGYIKESYFYYFMSYKNEILNYKEIAEQIDRAIEYRAEKLKKQQLIISKLDKLIEQRNKLTKELEENTKELGNLKICYTGYDAEL